MENVNDKELLNVLIDNYVQLQAIKNSSNTEKALEYQIKVLEGKLQTMGVTDLNQYKPEK